MIDVIDEEFSTIRVERHDAITRVELHNPPLNTVDDAMHHDLVRLFSLLKHDRSSRAIVLTGAGAAFSAGGDFAWFPSLRGAGRLNELRKDAKQIVWDLLDVEVPIVAAVNGPAVGLGASIALLSDVIYMAESATISDPHVRVGVVAGDGGTVIWPMAVGPARAKELLMTGDALTAARAEQLGLVNHVVADDSVQSEALAMARRLADGPPLAIQATKHCVNKLIKEALNSSFDTATAMEMLTFTSEDHQEALDALRERRRPHFQGR